MTPDVRAVLDLLDVGPCRVTALKDVPDENGSWLVEQDGGAVVVLRRYHLGATPEDLAYEHAVLRHLADLGWAVPAPAGDLVPHGDRWWCLTRFVPGEAVRTETAHQRRRRGRDLARLDQALRDLSDRIGQRPRWRAQHEGVSVDTSLDWQAALDAFDVDHPRMAAWAAAAAADTRAELAALGAGDLPVTVVHGDFAEWNVHYEGERLAGVVDFGLTHLDSRPYELAIARCYRSPETIEAYRDELARLGWPLSDLEDAAIEPAHRAFRVTMAAHWIDAGRRTGDYDLAMIERQLARSGTAPPEG